jgi:hypothetical protein
MAVARRVTDTMAVRIVRIASRQRPALWRAWFKPAGAIGARFTEMVTGRSPEQVWRHLLRYLPVGEKVVTAGDADPNVPYNTTPVSPLSGGSHHASET